MAFTYKNKKGKTYVLHGRNTKLKSGVERTIYFFSSSEQKGAMDKMPEGFEVMETQTGLPVLKRKDKKS